MVGGSKVKIFVEEDEIKHMLVLLASTSVVIEVDVGLSDF